MRGSIKRMNDEELRTLFRAPEGIHPCQIIDVEVETVSEDTQRLILSLEVAIDHHEYVLKDEFIWSGRQKELCSIFSGLWDMTPEQLVGKRLLLKIAHCRDDQETKTVIKSYLPMLTHAV